MFKISILCLGELSKGAGTLVMNAIHFLTCRLFPRNVVYNDQRDSLLLCQLDGQVSLSTHRYERIKAPKVHLMKRPLKSRVCNASCGS